MGIGLATSYKLEATTEPTKYSTMAIVYRPLCEWECHVRVYAIAATGRLAPPPIQLLLTILIYGIPNVIQAPVND